MPKMRKEKKAPQGMHKMPGTGKLMKDSMMKASPKDGTTRKKNY